MRPSTDPHRRLGLLGIFVLAALALASCGGGEPSTAPQTLQFPAGPPPDAALPAIDRPPPKVGLLLPLSGNLEALGTDFLDAAQLALFDVGETELELLPRDTGDTPVKARQAAQSALDAGAELLLGPFSGAATTAVVPLASPRAVPILSFSNDASIAGGNVWALGFRPQEQVQRVLDYALAQGLRRHAALAADDAYGNRAIAAWRSTLAAAPDAEEVVSQLYASNTTDPSDAARAVAGYGRSARADVDTALDAASLPPPEPPTFDALLVADGGQRLRSVLQVLPTADISPGTVRLLGTLLWGEDERVYREPAAQGAWLATWAPSSIDRFSARFRATYGREPLPLAVLAYDGVALAALLGQSEGRYTPEGLTDPQGYAGASGLFRLRPDGLAEHGLAIVEVRGGGLRTIDPAPSEFVDAQTIF